MDLKTYAVWRKLTTNSDLLKYVVENKPIPITVLTEDFNDVIDGLHEPNSELVVTDYERYLKEHIRLGFQPTSKNELDVQGEIEEPLMESIEMVHHVDRQDVIKKLITSVMHDVNADRDVEIDNVKLMKSVNEFVSLSEKPIFTSEEPNKEHPAVAMQSAPVKNESDNLSPVEFDVQPEPEINIDEITRDVEPENETAAVDIDFLANKLPETEIKLSKPIFEQPEQDNLTENQYDESVSDNANPSISNPTEIPDDEPVDIPAEIDIGEPVDADVTDDGIIKQPEEPNANENPFKLAYEYMVKQLKERNIDKRLDGLHLA